MKVPRCVSCQRHEKTHDTVYDAVTLFAGAAALAWLVAVVKIIVQLVSGAHLSWTLLAVTLGLLVLTGGLGRLCGMVPRNGIFLRAMRYPEVAQLLDTGWGPAKVRARPSATQLPNARVWARRGIGRARYLR